MIPYTLNKPLFLKSNNIITALLFCLMFLTPWNTQAQQPNDPSYIPNFTPPSPEASSLGQYGDHPVGYFTGIPSIKIPLFEISSGGITVPINLSYHASGIKVEQIASRVGMGWSLNAGGVVTKTVAGYEDNLNNPSWSGSPKKILGYFNLPSTYDLHTYIEEKDVYDPEPDPHFYNFPGHSGKFFFKDPTNYMLTNYENIKISSPYDGGYFEIKTDNGLIHRFEATEQTSISGTCDLINYGYTSAWYLTEIEDQISGKVMTFSYGTSSGTLVTEHAPSSTYQGVACLGNTYNSTCTKKEFLNNVKILNRIDFEDGYVEFDLVDRQDYNNDKAYSAIKLYNNADELIKGYTLQTSYEHIAGNTNAQDKRLFLNSISEISEDETTEEVRYSFDYKNPHLLPARDSKEQDIWGYFNDNNAQSLSPAIFLASSSFGRERYSIHSAGRTPLVQGADRTSNVAVIDYGTLNRITYPTGGYTDFEYEMHSFGQTTGAGIRIKAMTAYSASGVVATTKSYTYSGGKIPAAPAQAAVPASSTTDDVATFNQNRSFLGSNQSGYVGYDMVTVRAVDDNGLNSGVIAYEYTNPPDTEPVITGSDCNNMMKYSYYPFMSWESNELDRGLLQSISHYELTGNQQTPPLKVTNYIYDDILVDSKVIKMGVATANTTSNNGGLSLQAIRQVRSRLKPISIETQSFDDPSGSSFVTTTEYDYQSAAPYYLQSKSVKKSEGAYILTEFRYPFDFSSTASGGVMGDMVNLHYVSPVIQELVWNTTTSGAKYELLSGTLTDYDSWEITTGDFRILPATVYVAEFATTVGSASFSYPSDPSSPGNLFEPRAVFLDYNIDAKPTFLQQDGRYKKLRWTGERLVYTADFSNSSLYLLDAPPQGWSQVSSAEALVGNSYYSNTAQNAFPEPGPALVTFWAKDGTVTIGNATTGSAIQTVTAGSEWQFYSFDFRNEASLDNDDVYISGTAKLDEVRFIKGLASITKYYYDSRYRLSAISGADNTIRKFEYDDFGRLINVKDHEGLILNEYKYNYSN